MLTHHPFTSLGGANHGWLNAKHHFSFANYYDPKKMSHGELLVINDDRIAPHTGFDTHPHRDMEIITYVRRGAISHKDNRGTLVGQPPERAGHERRHRNHPLRV